MMTGTSGYPTICSSDTKSEKWRNICDETINHIFKKVKFGESLLPDEGLSYEGN